MAILGDGDIGTALKEVDRPDLLFFASGVSNSACEDEEEYQREIDLLMEQPKDSHLVYFSSLGVMWGDSRYFKHKRDMELMVALNFRKHTVVRLGNISWGDNPHTIVNFLRNRLRTGGRVDIQDVYRHIIDKEEFLYWMRLIPSYPIEMNCPGTMLKVSEIIDLIRDGEL